ncbi:MAG: TetR/AcrR family transcriptional regulator [Blautia sp.]|nr:TetR/AcrR family transcriptional regulator [Lachnoclostridium sp.]MCM1212622.1 TetR/AcrR family transcriptional regulator [Blautia sp.]
MPPRAKFTKEQIIEAALEIVRTENFESLTARALGKKLGSSACPIFTVFENMEEVQQATLTAARHVYRKYIKEGLSENPAFKGVGTQYILFAINEPKLFQILFMSEQSGLPDIDNVLPIIDESYDEILASITTGYGMEQEKAERLYKHLWIYTHGIASLCATKMCHFTGEEISRMISEVFSSLLIRMREEKIEN